MPTVGNNPFGRQACHPYHVCKNNPSQVARRVRKLSSEESNYEASKEKFSGHLKDRGYSEEIIQTSFEKFDQTERSSLFSEGKNDSPKTRCFPLVTQFNPHLPKVAPVLQKHKHLLLEDPIVSKFIPQESIFASYSQPKSIQSLLVSSTFNSASTSKTTGKCSKCQMNCTLCKYLLFETDTIIS